jgi:hypothetical protein
MAIAVQQIDPIAHLPLVLGVLRRLEVAPVMDRLLPSHPAHGLSGGRGVEALVLAILDGHHALSRVGQRLGRARHARHAAARAHTGLAPC